MRRGRLACAVVALAAFASACAGDDDTVAPVAPTSAPVGATTTAAPPYAGYRSDLYAQPDKWLCRPDLRDDVCREDLDVTVVEPDGTTRTTPHEVASDPPVDCFYVYPTLDFSDRGNAPIDGEPTPLELGTTHAQAGAFSSVCRVFAPRYRQLTLGAFGSGDRELAYGDVLDAFKHYMADDNEGRGVVLIGHSQGSGHLTRLLAEEFDDDPTLRDLLVSALLLGSGVRVPGGEDAGGDLANIPACRDEVQVACVVTYASFRSTSPPPPNSFFGRPRDGDGRVLCTNPAALRGGAAELDAWFPASAPAFADPASGPRIGSGLVAFPGLLRGECVDRGEFTYLEVTVHGDPADPRVDDIGGDLTPEWGLHAVDVSLALGDLVALVRGQADAWAAAGG